MIGHLTLFESSSLLAKTWNLGADGQPIKTVAAQLSRGAFRVLELENVDDLVALLGGVTTHQAVSASLPLDGSVSGRITTKRVAEPNAKIRSKSEFGLMPAPGILFLDHDSPEDCGMSSGTLWSTLLQMIPAFAQCGAVWMASGSSHVFKGDKDVTGLRGQHVYLLLADASDGPRVVQVLAARLWLAGLGTIQVSKAGSLLVRCLVDTAPSDAARLIFAGGAQCGAGLEQRRGAPVILNRGSFLDSRACVSDLTADEQGRFEAMVDQAKAAAAPEAARRRAEHRGAVISKRLPEMMKKGMSAADAEQKIGTAVDAAYGGVLLSDFPLMAVHDDGKCETVTVGEVLAARDRYHDLDVLDPLNPGHRNGAADCRLYLHGTSPIAYSLDDGGTVYRLRSAQQRLIVAKGCRGELVTQIAEFVSADSRVFSTAAGPVMVERGRMLALTVDRLMNLVSQLVVLVTKTAKGEALTDVTRETAVLVLAALGA